ncbi:uncharacterized protein N7518_002863 [Penicillium psychrosexuale]|uniref:uncharacterized protein n=1 Tax=Penicillium psychrosexuale TaxID=1002107 RepID=UPI00254505F6|nr:uncharacterized protein N7518_002863 [Penicillium psychrosexuale]KAJ5800795.1 hypothetical protein N7518_002863 [Penicillium psychrosexuale]
MITSYLLPADSLVLVTGANGFIASHTIDQLLAKGFRVRGTVRAPKPWLNAFFDERYGKGRFETLVITNLGDAQELDKAMKGVSGVIHMASDLTFSSDPNAVIPWVKDSVLKVLEAASRTETIQRVVLTSSSRAAFTSLPGTTKGLTVEDNTFNDDSVKAAWDPDTPADVKPFAVYSASKTESEKAAWEWMKENKPHFDFNTVLPDFNTGKVLHPEIGGSTMGYVRKLLKGDSSPFETFPPQWYVDVEDTARLHVIALLSHEVKSERLFAFAESKNWTDHVEALSKLRPDNKLIPKPPVNEARDEANVVPAKRAESLLQSFYGRPGWTPFHESLAAGIEGLE